MRRRDFMKQATMTTVAGTIVSEGSSDAEAAPTQAVQANAQATRIIDTHVHLWDLNRFRLPWLEKDSPLARSHVMKDYQTAIDGLNVVKGVYMEVDVDPKQLVAEAEYVLDICRQDADACAVSERYLGRWQIEKAFNHITLAYECEIKPLCYPRAALLCFANALVAYNAVSILNALISTELGRETADSMSHFYMASEIKAVTDGLLVALPEPRWSDIATMPINELVSELRQIASGIELRRYRKSVRGPKKPVPKKIHNRRHVHVSAAKILAARG